MQENRKGWFELVVEVLRVRKVQAFEVEMRRRLGAEVPAFEDFEGGRPVDVRDRENGVAQYDTAVAGCLATPGRGWVGRCLGEAGVAVSEEAEDSEERFESKLSTEDVQVLLRVDVRDRSEEDRLN